MLTVKKVDALKYAPHPKGYPTHVIDGNGLYLQISRGGSKSWLLKTSVNKKRIERGLGSYPEVSLAEARDKARDMRAALQAGLDPKEEAEKVKKQAEAEAKVKEAEANKAAFTFADAIKAYLPDRLHGYKNEKHKAQWYSTLETYAKPLLKMPIANIDTDDVYKVLKPIWTEKNETASRVRGRIEAVLAWATVRKYRKGPNPATYKHNLEILLPSVPKSKGNHPGLQVSDAPPFFAQLKTREGMGARALEFLMLTAARSGEVRGAHWEEVDNGIWTIPASRMKAGKEHRVPLSQPAKDLLDAMPRLGPYIFPSATGGMISDMTLAAVIKRIGGDYTDRVSGRMITPHGMRSCFRTWAAEQGHDRDMAEMALAHTIAGAVERAYMRSDMMERRRGLMQEWAEFLSNDQT